MKTLAISTLALTLLSTLTHAAPAPIQARQFAAQVTFIGGADTSFTMSFPADGRVFTITNPLSISHISSLGGAICGFKGIDGSDTVLVGAQTMDVGPPQTQISGSCRAL